ATTRMKSKPRGRSQVVQPIECGADWACIPSLNGYRFDRSGRVWSCWVRGSKKHRVSSEWNEIKPRPNVRRDYLYVTLKTPDGRKHFRVNVLILWAFTGSRPDGLEAAHLDGDRSNNRVENLAWKTHAENIADKAGHGTVRKGEGIVNS